MKCQSCMYFNDNAKECRRYAPQPGDDAAKAKWPTVAADDWCGEYKEDAQKAKKTA